jgi:hypothetical protein
VEFQGGFGFPEELFGLIAGWEVALNTVSVDLAEVGLPFHNA